MSRLLIQILFMNGGDTKVDNKAKSYVYISKSISSNFPLNEAFGGGATQAPVLPGQPRHSDGKCSDDKRSKGAPNLPMHRTMHGGRGKP